MSKRQFRKLPKLRYPVQVLFGDVLIPEFLAALSSLAFSQFAVENFLGYIRESFLRATWPIGCIDFTPFDFRTRLLKRLCFYMSKSRMPQLYLENSPERIIFEKFNFVMKGSPKNFSTPLFSNVLMRKKYVKNTKN